MALLPFGQSGNWNLIFADEFEGTELDLTKWHPNWFGEHHLSITKSVDETNIECVDPTQIRVANEELNLYAVRGPSTVVGGVNYKHRSGLINSNGRFHFTYGYMEASILQPAGTGMWPAFWSNGQNWPDDGEIDVLEGDGTGDSAYHYHYPGGAPGGSVILPDATSDWNTYAAHWEPGVITWYYNGSPVWQLTNADLEDGYSITSSPHYLILHLGLNAPSNALPAVMRVSHVRVWQKKRLHWFS